MDIYPNISEVLKIPMYLQKAKRYEEAWAVYNKLLEERFEDNSDYLGISKIYDKMRIQLQSEKKFGDALIMGIYSYMWDAAELKKTGNSAQYEKYTFKVELIKLAENLLKKTKQESAKDQIADIIGKYIKTLPELDKERFEKEIFECIESEVDRNDKSWLKEVIVIADIVTVFDTMVMHTNNYSCCYFRCLFVNVLKEIDKISFYAHSSFL